MKTTLFLSVSIDGMIADKQGIPMFPEGAWEDWCSLVNDTGNVIAGRSSFEQVNNPEMGAALHPKFISRCAVRRGRTRSACPRSASGRRCCCRRRSRRSAASSSGCSLRSCG